MKITKYVILPLSVLLLIYLTITPSFSAEPAADRGYIIGPGDVLTIQVWGQDDLTRTQEVSQEGDITFPLIGKIHAAGVSVFDLEDILKNKLGAGYIVAPQVTVGIKEYQSRKVQVLGEVKKPGTYVLKGSMRLLELISEAGGLTADAGRMATILRSSSSPGQGKAGDKNISGVDESIQIDLLDQFSSPVDQQKWTIHDGDTIIVGKVSRLFVTGEVKKPGEIKWEKGLTVHQAIALAGGPTNRAAPKRTHIIRTEKGQDKKIKPSMNDPVQPDDIIEVPESWF